jgi:hypothetical protein
MNLTACLLAIALGSQAPNSEALQAQQKGSVPRTLQEKLSESVSVKDFGACGDGVCDDSLAFDRAVKSGAGRIRIPVGSYRLTKPLDLTNIQAGPLILFGDGWSSAGAGSSLVCDTGTVCIDVSGSAYATIEDLAIDPGRSKPSTVGLLFARSAVGRYSSFNGLRNVRIHLPHNPTANGGAGTVGIYDDASENWKYQGGLVYADIPLVFTASNIYGIQSSHTSVLNGYTSMSVVELSGSVGLVAYGGPAIKVAGAANLHLGNTYMLSAPGNTFEFAMAIDSTEGLEYSGSVESFHRLVITTSRLEGLVLGTRIVPVAGKSLIELDGTQGRCCAGLWKSDIRLQMGAGSDSVHDLVHSQGPAVSGVAESFLALQPKETLTIASGEVDYNIIQTPNALSSINLPNGTGKSNVILASDGISVGASATFAGPVQSRAGFVVNGAAGATASGKSCSVTAVTGGIVTGVACLH